MRPPLHSALRPTRLRCRYVSEVVLYESVAASPPPLHLPPRSLPQSPLTVRAVASVGAHAALIADINSRFRRGGPSTSTRDAGERHLTPPPSYLHPMTAFHPLSPSSRLPLLFISPTSAGILIHMLDSFEQETAPWLLSNQCDPFPVDHLACSLIYQAEPFLFPGGQVSFRCFHRLP